MTSELDRWFPRSKRPEPEPEPQPDPGVIEGARRNTPRRYTRRWYVRMRQGQDGATESRAERDECH